MGRALLVGVAVVASGCGYLFTEFQFDREVEIEAGEIRGQAVRADLDNTPPASFARVLLKGAGAIRQAGSDGAFAFKGLAPGPWVLQVLDDTDGDGWPERTSTVSAVVRVGPKPSGLLGEGAPETSAVLLGKVPVDGTTLLKGRVLVDTQSGRRTPAELGAIARVIVTRDFDLPTAVADAFNTVSLGAEAQTAADSSGTFVFSDIGSGTFQVLAFLFEDTGNPAQPGRILAATPPVFLRGFAGGAIDITGTPLLAPPIGPAPLDGERGVQVIVAPAPEGSFYVMAVPQGLPAPQQCEATPPDYSNTELSYVVTTGLLPGATDALFSLPYGVWDLYACTHPDDDGRKGVLYQVTVAPSGGDPAEAAPVVVGPMLLTADDPCGPPDAPDCDGDGRVGLPPLVDVNQALWAGCVEACGEAFGEAAATATCAVGEQTFDCDDDGDGQPDVTEPAACYGVGQGTDLDGDSLCSGQDPYPQCAVNDAVACVAGEYDFNPQPHLDALDRTFAGAGFATFSGPGNGEDVATAVSLDDTGHIVVAGSTVDLGGSSSMALWRLLPDGRLDPDFGARGGLVVLSESLEEPLVGVHHAAALHVDAASGDIYVAGTLQAGQSGDLVLWKLGPDGQPVTDFGGGYLVHNLGDWGEVPEETNDEAHAMLAHGGVLYVAGAGEEPGFVGQRRGFVCAFDAFSGALRQDVFVDSLVPGCAFLRSTVDGPFVDDYGYGVARLADGTFAVVGQRGVESQQAWLWLVSPAGVSTSDGPVSTSPGSSARAAAVGPDGQLYVAGTDTDPAGAPLMALWRGAVAGFERLLSTRGSGTDAYGNALAFEGGGKVFVVGKTRTGAEHDLLVFDYDPERNAARPVLEHDAAAGESGDAAGYSVLVDGEGRLVIGGSSFGAEDSDMTVWRLAPRGSAPLRDGNDMTDGGPDPDAGPGGDAGVDVGSPCADDATCNDVVCPEPAVPMCVQDRCACAPLCDLQSPDTYFSATPVVVRSPTGSPIPPNVTCIVADVTFDSYSQAELGAELPALRRVQGSLSIVDTLQQSPLARVRFDNLYAVDGDLTLRGNWRQDAPGAGLSEVLLPALHRVTGGYEVGDNKLLPTPVAVSLLNRLHAPPATTSIFGNACDPALGDSECVNVDEQCVTDAQTATPVCLSPM